MRNINRIRWIVQDEDIRLDENDAISIKVWATRLQQEGAEIILIDKIDAPPLGSGLSPDTFVFCIQTKFQKDQFREIGNGFLGIDATHNTTQYVGLQLFTLIARDRWGHGALRSRYSIRYFSSLDRRSGGLDAVIERDGGYNTILSTICQGEEPDSQSCNHYERS